MEHPKVIEYKGEFYRLQTTGRYYQNWNKDAEERLLHRRVWVDNFGPIPEGMQVHHKNGDWTDNRPENLELVEKGKHSSEHMRKRMSDPSYRENALSALARAQDSARAWHASDEGREWHSRNSKKMWETRKPVKAVCTVCGKEFETFFPSRARFCSTSCEKKEGYQRNKTAEGVCAYCGKHFFYNKYRVQKYCSRKCASKARSANKSSQSDA